VTTLTVASYNVRSLRDSETASALLVRRFGVDAALLQEAPRFLRWRARLAAFARNADLLYAAGGGTTGGSALLLGLRTDLVATYELKLTKHPRLHQRGIAAAAIELGGARAIVASTHMSLDDTERALHAGEVIEHLYDLATRHETEHLVLAGDLNEQPGGPAWQVLAAGGLTDAWPRAGARGGEMTFSAVRPHKRIDAVLTSARVGVHWVGVPEDVADGEYGAASDHRPVLARLELP
jgi:endonuclease/exonuclease/phosphatase family metal-dependent hydrolase